MKYYHYFVIIGTHNNRCHSDPVHHAKKFIATIRIKRTKFDQFVASGKIKIIKKRHKIYLLVTEIDRYFKDSTIP